ncbi:hypothetical protein [Streptomyces sp. NRRL WC-3549]|uniref:hypothetical protein n=1 Tax=Streptomyces sp. NRRL WC-3549 TaxID=1463925 RepID=UPI001F3A3079|nr:hypothetical protein [Streptomyces sp. NRRL WC-3549]
MDDRVGVGGGLADPDRAECRGPAPIRVEDVGVELGLEVEAKGRLEPLRGKLSKSVGRGRLRKLPDGRFQIAP